MSWLDVGNGWRNLYLLSTLLQMGALGCLFCAKGWFSKRSRLACFLTGVSAVPLVQYLWTMALAFLWPHAPKLVYIGALPAASAIALAVMALRRVRRLRECLSSALAFARRCLRFDKPALIALCFALCIALLIGPACVRFMSSMDSVSGGDTGEYLGLALRFCEDRDAASLLAKEDPTGTYRGHSHFPSLEWYMSYGLLHTGGELGYPHDKACFTGLGLLIFYVLAAYGALLLHFCREKKVCVLLGAVLFNLIPQLYYSVAGAPRDLWRILALLWATLAFLGLTEEGNWKRYLLKLLWCFLLCFTVMSAHVVCFVVLPFIVIAWVLWRFAHAALSVQKGAWRALLRSVGLAVSGAAGTLLAFSGNLWCYLKWGQMSPWRLMTTFTDAPWYPMYMDIEYKLEETTTHLNFFEAADSILMSYATPIGLWGLRLSLIALGGALAFLVFSRIQMRRQLGSIASSASDGPVAVIITRRTSGTETASGLILCALATLFTLAPMTGILDSPLYSFSGSFLKLPRYTLQWFFMANVMICAALSAVLEHWDGWLARLRRSLPAWVHTLPAWLCALLCLLAMVKGLNQTGYTNTFYRPSRGVMESESILLDNSFRNRYGLLMEVADHVAEDHTILITRSGYQYPLRSRGTLLTANSIVSLMNLPAQEVPAALAALDTAMLATEPAFWDERYYPLSGLNEYLQTLPAEQIVQTETMRLYLLDPALVPHAQRWLENHPSGGNE